MKVSFKLYSYGTVNLREITRGKKVTLWGIHPRHSRTR